MFRFSTNRELYNVHTARRDSCLNSFHINWPTIIILYPTKKITTSRAKTIAGKDRPCSVDLLGLELEQDRFSAPLSLENVQTHGSN
jgi:hypothetical protein